MFDAATQKEERIPKNRCSKSQRLICSQSQGSHKNNKLMTMIYAQNIQKTLCRPVQSQCLPFEFL